MTKQRRLILLLCIILLCVLLLGASLFTLSELNTVNPVSAAIGLFRVCILEEPYVQIQHFSPVYLSQPEDGFDLFLAKMQEWGYTHLPEAQMGSVHYFESAGGEQIGVRFLVNSYFAKWIWY